MMDYNLLRRLNAGNKEERLDALREAVKTAQFPPMDERMINNHIHTTYSFSPYSPAAAVYAARNEGLCTAGIVDHDSMGGAEEFVEAGKIVGLPTTVGVEMRVSYAETPLHDRRTNNPDQIGVSYMVLHGVPHKNIQRVQEFLAPYREKRNARNRKMVEKINAIYGKDGIALDFDKDVLPLSMFHDGGGVTERHLMLALAQKISGKVETDYDSMLELYDLVGKLKKECIPQVFIPATDECPTLQEMVAFAKEVDGILAYAYLGDVTQSVTGDKKAQTFEDAYLDELFEVIAAAGVKAVTYMPTRNTPEQLNRLRALCEQYGMLQISGEDINSPRQSFVIEKMRDEQFSNLIASTWQIIHHENGGNEQ